MKWIIYQQCLSVIVPAYNAEKNIATLIESLLHLDYPKELLEIIIVDNNSTDRTKEIINQYPVKLLEEKNIQSSYAARNTGIRNSKGEILAFTDSDCMVSDEWLKSGIQCLQEGAGDIIIGEVKSLSDHKLNIFEKYDKITAFRHSCKTWNLITPKKVFDKVGFFNERLISGGDTEWGERAKEKGVVISLCKQAVVYHPLRSCNSLFKKQIRVGYGAGQKSEKIKLFNFPQQIIKLFVEFLFWLLSVGKMILNAYRTDKITLFDLISFCPITLIFGLVTTYGKMKAMHDGIHRDKQGRTYEHI
jgi:glycosyltransferase involved in cell wall biosynthesis